MAPGRARKHAKGTTTTRTELSAAAQLDSASDYSQPSLAAVDSTLRCPICTELFAAPVILTTCSHSFDSRCLREYLVGHKRCPSCLRECNEDNIRLNLALQGAVAAWKDARAALLHLQSLASTAQAGPSSPSPAAHPPAPTATRTSGSAASGKRKASALASSSSSPAVKNEPHEPAALVLVDDGSSDVEIIEEGTMPSSTSRRVPPRKKARAEGGSGKGKGRARLEEADPTDPSLILECPLCGGSIKNALMALHVERCNGVPPPATASTSAAWGKLLGANGRGGGARDGDSDSSSSNVREGSKLDTTRALPLANYARKSIQELNDMLKAYELPTTIPSSSSRDTPALSTDAKLALLVRRHRQFLVLWNANADLAPDDPAHKSAPGVRDELRRWEKTQGAATGAAGASGGASAQGGSGEWSAKAHLKQYADDFRELVAQARASALAARQPRQEAEPAQTQDDKMEVDEEEGARAQEAQPASRATGPVAVTTTTSASVALVAGVAGAPVPRRTVRILSPPPRSSPSPPASPSPRARTSSSSSPPPLLLLSHDLDSPTARPSTAGARRTTTSRSSSPFDAERPPRASQRNREEERMFAEMEAAREEAEARAAAGEGAAEGGGGTGSDDEGEGAKA
ncbi:hypothetical protein JCM9279_004521 [Rhodotorula babjevae]